MLEIGLFIIRTVVNLNHVLFLGSIQFSNFGPYFMKANLIRRSVSRRRMFATNRFVTSACSGQSVTSRLWSITSWHFFVNVNVFFHAYDCHEVHIVAKFKQSRTYVPKSSRKISVYFFLKNSPTCSQGSTVYHKNKINFVRRFVKRVKLNPNPNCIPT